MRVPRATYRLQLGPGLTFDAAAALVDYPDALGVSDAYTSPFLDALTASLGGEHADVVALKSLITWFATLPPHAEKGPEGVAARRRDKEVGREKLVALLEASPAVRAFVGENIRLFNGKPGDAQSMDLLDALLTEQAYRAAYWRVAGEEINYRRFFDINELAAIRMEEPEVFEATHRLLFRLVREGAVTGLRIDHPDGLYDPADYFRRLHEGAGGEIYVVAEKILAPGEQLPDSWATAGTTGYEFPNLLNGIFVDRAQARAMEQNYARLIRHRPGFTEIVHDCKRLIMETSMAAELNMLAHRLNAISEKHRTSRDFTLCALTRALREAIAAFPVYRTYISGDRASEGAPTANTIAITDRDRDYIRRAIATARRQVASADASIYDWIEQVLMLVVPDR